MSRKKKVVFDLNGIMNATASNCAAMIVNQKQSKQKEIIVDDNYFSDWTEEELCSEDYSDDQEESLEEFMAGVQRDMDNAEKRAKEDRYV